MQKIDFTPLEQKKAAAVKFEADHPAKARAIKAAYRAGKISRKEAISQLQALGFE